MNPSFSTVTSSFTTSPGASTRGPGMPWTTSSLTLMQVDFGKLYTRAGADRAPFRSITSRATSSISAVVIPGRTARRIASSVSAATRPAVCRPFSSASD